MPTNGPLPADRLFNRCDPAEFAFSSTDELEELKDMVGQDRAIEAVEFGVEMETHGYNLFVLGPSGTGRHSFVQRYLKQKAAERETPSDWCYANNFDEPRMPIALELPSGAGRALRDEIERVIDDAHAAIPTAFESEDYRTRRRAIEQKFQEGQAERFQSVQDRASDKGISIMQTPNGIQLVPVRDGEPMSPQAVQELPEEDRERLQEETKELTDELQAAMQTMPSLVREVREEIADLDREVAMLAVGSLIDDLVSKYADMPKVTDYLKSMQSDMIENVSLFLADGTGEEQQEAGSEQRTVTAQQPKASVTKRRYGLNLLVDHHGRDGAPLITEDHPTYQNLIGEVEYLAQMGALVTDYHLIKSGALHRANGGYLVLDAHKVLTEPFAWQGLKQALKNRRIRMESLGQAYSLMRTATLEPEAIPLNLKIVLIGERQLYYILQQLDPEFMELFKVAADFDDRMDRSPENNRLFAQLLGTIAKQERLKPLDRTAVARLIEESGRHAGHSRKLSSQVRKAADILREANYWAARNGNGHVTADDVQLAIDKRIYRAGRVRERLQEEILEETILIDTKAEQVGQVNGLAVSVLGEFSFARPSRITARVAPGSGKVTDIEREAKLGGPLHSKGVLILAGYLAGRYMTDRPLSLAASLVLEQSYAGIEGDSASSAELYALLSALAETPVRQCFAVTGSVNQHGAVQAIGGVNEKIEGFFDICSERGLTGDQGVLIPASNVKNLMLRKPVIDAVEEGRFAVYPVSTIDEGIELLTGVPAGEIDDTGAFPQGTLNRLVCDRLARFADIRRAHAAEPETERAN